MAERSAEQEQCAESFQRGGATEIGKIGQAQNSPRAEQCQQEKSAVLQHNESVAKRARRKHAAGEQRQQIDHQISERSAEQASEHQTE